MATPTEGIAAIVDALGKLAWPALASIVLWRLFPTITKALESRGLRIKVGDMEVSLQEASEQLSDQVADLQKKVEALRAAADQSAKPLAKPAAADAPLAPSAQLRSPAARQPPPRRVLWVDDNPANNAYEVARLRSEGIEVIEATTTDEGVRLAVSGNPPGAIVTDMGRTENGRFQPHAGLELLRALRQADVRTPVFVYSSARQAERIRAELASLHGDGATGSPVELFEMIHAALAAA